MGDEAADHIVMDLEVLSDQLASRRRAIEAQRAVLGRRRDVLEAERRGQGSASDAAAVRPREQAKPFELLRETLEGRRSLGDLAQRLETATPLKVLDLELDRHLETLFLGEVRAPLLAEELERIEGLDEELARRVGQIDSLREEVAAQIEANALKAMGDLSAADGAEPVRRRAEAFWSTTIQTLALLDIELVLDLGYRFDLRDLATDDILADLDPLLGWETIELLQPVAADPDAAPEPLGELLGPSWDRFAAAPPAGKMTMIASLIAGARGMDAWPGLDRDLFDQGAGAGPAVLDAVEAGGQALARAGLGILRHNPGFRDADRTFHELQGEAGERAARRAGVSSEVLGLVRRKITVRHLQALHTQGPAAARTILRLYFALGSVEHLKVLEILIGRRFVLAYRVWRAGLVVQVLRPLMSHYPGVKIEITGSVGVKGRLKIRSLEERSRELETAKDLDITITGSGSVGRAQLSLENMLRSLFGESWIQQLDMTLFGDPRMAVEEPLCRFLTRGIGLLPAAHRLKKQIREWVDEALGEYDGLAGREALVRNRDILIGAWGESTARSWFADRDWTWPEDGPDETTRPMAPLDPEARASTLAEFDDLRASLASRGGQLTELEPDSRSRREAEADYRRDLDRYAEVYHRMMAGTPGAYVLRGTRKMWVIDREAILPSFGETTPATHTDNVIEHFGLGWHYTTPGHVDVLKAAKYWPRLLASRGSVAISLPNGRGIGDLLDVAAEIKAAKDTTTADTSLSAFYDCPAEAATRLFIEDLQYAGAAVAEHWFPARPDDVSPS